MPKVALTSLIPSSLIIGRAGPAKNKLSLSPRETKTVDLAPALFRSLKPDLDKLQSAGWVNYTVKDEEAAAPTPAPVVEAPAPAPEATYERKKKR